MYQERAEIAPDINIKGYLQESAALTVRLRKLALISS
jgi:hypothetical protein